MKRLFLIASVTLCSLQCFAQGAGQFSFYADIRNDFNYYTREGVYDRYGLFNLLPAESRINEVGIDLAEYPTMEWLNFDTKAGVEWNGFRVRDFEMQAKLEAEVYCKAGSSAMLRLRQAYFNLGYNIDRARKLNLLLGQDNHPFAIEKPDMISYSCGAPYNAYNYAPQLKLEVDAFKWMSVSLAALWQGEFCSNGWYGWSTDYIKWSCIPELYLGLHFKHKGFYGKVGVDYLSIKPRLTGTYPGTEVEIWVGDKLQNLSYFLSLGYEKNKFAFKAKTIFAQGGEHMNLMGGYALCSIKDNGTWTYTPYTTSSSWFSLCYGGKLKGALFGGYIENLGTSSPLYFGSTEICMYNQDCCNLLRAAKVAPSIKYTFWDMLTVGFECEFSAAQYGDKDRIIADKGLCLHGLKYVFGNRASLTVSCQLDSRKIAGRMGRSRQAKDRTAPYEASRAF